LLASSQLLMPAAADETPGNLYYPYVPADSWDSVMINGPKCLGTMQESIQIGSLQCESDIHKSFLDTLQHWRTERRIYVGYDGSRYDSPALRWTQSNFIQPQTMVEDRYFYDPVAGQYTVDRYLDDVVKRYGGIDSILLWPVYPNLGIDDRNQLDMILAMPGGVAGVKHMIADFHRRGVRVLFPMNMWDQGTHDPGVPWPAAIAKLMAEIGADGINGDTQNGVPLAFSQEAERTGHPLAFQPEGPPSDEALAWNVLSWWEEDSSKYAQFVPKVNRYKWLEPRHMANISDRWNRIKTDDLQVAFFNGIGWESWENVWGIWNGITPRDAEATQRMATIERGVATFLVSSEWEPMKAMTAKPLASLSNEWRTLPQHMVTIASTIPAKTAAPGMIEIPAGEFDFKVQGLEVEGGDNIGVDIAYAGEDSARRFHQQEIKINRFYIDRYSVSNAQFKAFLDTTRYHPKDDLNFLKDWKNGTYPEGWANKPVTWVSLEDARAYAAWAGKRLPHEWEWQYAAQGTDGRLYPWGNEWKAAAVPVPEKGRALRGPDDSAAHPMGASFFGVMDMIGNVWQWTDEYVDEHTRAAILRGGSYYQPQGSIWYFPQAYRNDQHGKLLLMAPSKDRAGTLGFRCVIDAETKR
jgi:formylglycine-generating enzyme required for sulfatase activity